MLSLGELFYFCELGIPIKYTITIRKKDGGILTIYPCKPPKEICLAYADEKQTKKCLIYSGRPSSCKIYPFIMRIYYKTPPRYEEIIKSLRVEETDLKGIRIKPFIRKIDDNRWVFLGYEDRGDFCKGNGKGRPWSEDDIRNYIAKNIYLYANMKERMNETVNVLTDQLLITNEKDMLIHFKPLDIMYSDEILKILLCEPINRPPGILLGNIELKKTLLGSRDINIKPD